MSSRPAFAFAGEDPQHYGLEAALTYYWDVATLTWVKGTQGAGGGAGGSLTDAELRATPVPISGTFWQATQPVSGTFWQATQPVSGTVTANAGTGIFSTKPVRAATPTQSSVPGSASNVSLLAANAARLGATIFNDSSALLYVKLGVTASTSSYTVQMVAGSYYELPYDYTGAVDGIWASATGNARITELAA